MTTMTAVAPVRVLIADDHAPTRSDVRDALEESGRFAVCAEAADAAAAVEAAVRERPELCVLDVRMPGGGVAAVWEIAARLPETKIVMLTVSADDGDLFAALRAGADGYLLKNTDLGPLPQALEDVLEGRAAIPPALVARLVSEFRDRRPRRRSILARDDGPQLTSREWQVLDLMRQELADRRDRAPARRLADDGAHARRGDPPQARRTRSCERGAPVRDAMRDGRASRDLDAFVAGRACQPRGVPEGWSVVFRQSTGRGRYAGSRHAGRLRCGSRRSRSPRRRGGARAHTQHAGARPGSG